MSTTLPGQAQHQRYYEIITRRDPAFNGRFFTGVLTTGIYCLPSCAARTPKPENIRFFDSPASAEAAGLRPCKRCKPDRLELYEEERKLERLVDRLRREPDRFSGADALAEAFGCGQSKLNTLCHAHYHATPAHLVAQARIAWATERLQEGREVGEVGVGCGYESLSGFYEQFRRFACMTPGEYRDLGKGGPFRLTWPDRFGFANWRRYLGRDPDSACDRITADHYQVALHLDDDVALLDLTWNDAGLVAQLTGSNQAFAAHRIVCRLLGANQDLDGFRALMSTEPADEALLHQGVALRIPQTVSVWDSVVWAILGQQVNIAFAARLRARLARLAGSPAPDGLVALPTPEQVARLEVSDLLPHQFSARKAEYVIGIARTIVANRLDVERMPLGPVQQVERDLVAQRGIGPWAANYILMRGCGFMDATPLGDTGLTSGLQRRFQLAVRPDSEETQRLMKRYAPYRSLATYHLWQSLSQGIA